MYKLKKGIAFIMALIMSIGIFSNFAYADTEWDDVVDALLTQVAAEPGTTNALSGQVTLVGSGGKHTGVRFKGDEPGATNHTLSEYVTVVKDMPGTAGYCITPFARGVMPSGEEQTLDIIPDSQLNDLDKQLLGILMAGYPNKTHGWNTADEYAGTHLAMRHFIFQHPEQFPNSKGVKFDSDSWDHWDNDPIMELAKLIYEEGINNPYNPSSSSANITVAPDNNGQFVENGEFYEMLLTISADGSFDKAKLTIDPIIKEIVESNAKSQIYVGSKTAKFEIGILGSTDFNQGIKILPGDTTVKIVLEKTAATAYLPGGVGTKQFDYKIEGVGGNNLIAAKGKNVNSKNQDYIFMIPSAIQPASGIMTFANDDEPTPDTPTGKGGLKILKYNML